MRIKFVGHRPRELAYGFTNRILNPGETFDATTPGLASALLDQPRWFRPDDDEARDLLAAKNQPASEDGEHSEDVTP